MGLSSDIHNIVRTIKRIPGIPNDVYRKMKGDLRALESKLDGLDIGKIGPTILAEVTRIVETAFAGVQTFVDKRIDDSQQFIQMSLDTINTEITDKFGSLEGLVSKIPDYFDAAIAEVQRMIVNPVGGFIKKYITPLIVGAILVFISPVLFPLLGFIFK